MRLLSIAVIISIALCGCSGGENGSTIDRNTSIPKGDPAFPKLDKYWVIDKTDSLSFKTIEDADAICQGLQADGVAEVVVVIINGVKCPQDWATHYGRWLKLGKKGRSSTGGNNGIVWLIRPDADEKIFVSVGRGLPKFTSTDYRKVMDKAINYINFGNIDRGVEVIVRETDKEVRAKYGNGGNRSKNE